MLGTDDDKGHFEYLLHHVVEEHRWQVLDWVLMSNHHHLVLRLREPNLSVGMQRLHGLHAVGWNKRHGAMGHAWQGRFVSRGIERPDHGARVMRYVPRNPVAAGLVDHPAEWSWGGYRALAGMERPRPFHDIEEGLRGLERLPGTPLREVQERYRRFVTWDLDALPRTPGVEGERPGLGEIVRPGDPESIEEAIEFWGYAVSEVARHLGVSTRTVQRRRSVAKGSDRYATRANVR